MIYYAQIKYESNAGFFESNCWIDATMTYWQFKSQEQARKQIESWFRNDKIYEARIFQVDEKGNRLYYSPVRKENHKIEICHNCWACK